TRAGATTRRYHGLLIAAHPAPLGRVMMVNHLWEFLRLPDYRTIPFGGEEKIGKKLLIHGAEHLLDFRLESGLPVWRYEVEGYELEKRVYFAYRHNTVFIRYHLTGGSARVRLKLKPSVHFRGHDDHVSTDLGGPYRLTAVENHYELAGRAPSPILRMTVSDGRAIGFTAQPEQVQDIIYRVEEARGYEYHGTQYSPGQFRLDLEPGQTVTLVFSTESWD